MFAIPQPKPHLACLPPVSCDALSNLKDQHDCPVVHLHDSADDVANLLIALYDGPNFADNDANDFRIVSGILRLSTKYIIDSLRTKAVQHLTTAWPSTLKAWDTREDLARSFELEAGWNSHRYPSPIDVINLAREVDAPSLLPAAFYDLSRYSFSQIFEPVHDERLSPSAALSNADLQKLALGKEAAQNHITTLIRAMGAVNSLRPAQIQQHHTAHLAASHHGHHHHHHPGDPRKASVFASSRGICVSPSACRKDFGELVDLATQHYLFDKERGCMDPLYVAEELGQLKSGGAEFCECKPCAVQLELWAARERERMWKLVPSWFRLDSEHK